MYQTGCRCSFIHDIGGRLYGQPSGSFSPQGPSKDVKHMEGRRPNIPKILQLLIHWVGKQGISRKLLTPTNCATPLYMSRHWTDLFLNSALGGVVDTEVGLLMLPMMNLLVQYQLKQNSCSRWNRSPWTDRCRALSEHSPVYTTLKGWESQLLRWASNNWIPISCVNTGAGV